MPAESGADAAPDPAARLSDAGPTAPTDSRPVLFVTTAIPPDRVGAFRALAARTPIEFALFGGGLHATAGVEGHGLPVRHVSQREVYGLAASGKYRAVVAGTVGRTALPGAWLGAERARVPFILWTALWAHPRSPAHLPGALLLRLLYRRAAAVVTYGPHVSGFAESHGASHTIVAPQAVDVDFWSQARFDRPSLLAAAATAEPPEPPGPPPTSAAPRPSFLFIGRDDPGKGVDWLLAAWAASGLAESTGATLRLVGPEPARAAGHAGATALGPLTPTEVRGELTRAETLVVPSERTATFREPWGLVVNEAMHAGVLVIASTQVGAVAGGLAVDGETALVVQAGDVSQLAAALGRAAAPEAPETQEIRAAGTLRAAAYTYDAWAGAFARALVGSVA